MTDLAIMQALIDSRRVVEKWRSLMNSIKGGEHERAEAEHILRQIDDIMESCHEEE